MNVERMRVEQWGFIPMYERLAARTERTYRKLGSQFHQDASFDRTLWQFLNPPLSISGRSIYLLQLHNDIHHLTWWTVNSADGSLNNKHPLISDTILRQPWSKADRSHVCGYRE